MGGGTFGWYIDLRYEIGVGVGIWLFLYIGAPLKGVHSRLPLKGFGVDIDQVLSSYYLSFMACMRWV